MKRALLFLLGGTLLGQTPPILDVGSDAVTSTSARIHWTSGFYHDVPSDTTLTTGFTTGSICETRTVTVGSTAKMKGWMDGFTPTSFILGGTEWGRVKHVIDATHADVEIVCGMSGIGSLTENFYETRAGLSISVSAGTATATLYYPAGDHWTTGHRVLVWMSRTPGLDSYPAAYVITGRPDSTHITFNVNCSPGCNGTHNYSTDSDMRLEDWSGGVHAAGETISFVGTDAKVCYGDPGGAAGVYTHSATVLNTFPQAQQSSKHFVYLTAQTPGSRIHYIVLSTPLHMGTSNCSSIGPNTGRSPDQAIDFPGPATDTATPKAPTGVTFSTALPTPYADSKLVGTDCPDLQTCLNTARSTAGNHEIRIPAGTTLAAPADGWILPPQSGGSLVTTIRTSAEDTSLPAPGACLPPLAADQPSPCIDNPTYTASLATLQTSNAPSAIFRLAPNTAASGIHLGPGVKIQPNPHLASVNHKTLIDLGHTAGEGLYDHASHSNNFIIDRVYFYQKNIQNGAFCALFAPGGNSIAFVDSVIEGIANRVNDMGGIAIASGDAQDGGFVIKNNRIQAAFDTIYLTGDGWNTGPGVIQQNWLHMSDAWNHNSINFAKQVQLPVASATAGSPTTITLTDPAEFGFQGQYDMSVVYVSFTGAVGSGTWDKLNAREFSLSAGTLGDFNCNGTNCIAATTVPHGFQTGDFIWMGNLAGYACNNEAGAHQITVTDASHFRYPSSTNKHCLYYDATVLGPVFHPSYDNLHFTIPFDSTGFPALSGTVTARYGTFVNTKNLAECKTCVGWDISGNLFSDSITHEQNAAGFSLTNRIAGAFQDIKNFNTTATISDIYFHDNWFRRVGVWMGTVGIQDYGSNIPMNRVTVKNNLVTDSTDIACTPGESCMQGSFFLTYGTHIVWDHNTALTPAGISVSGAVPPPPFGDWTLTNSIHLFGSTGLAVTDSSNRNHVGAQLYQTSGTCKSGPCAVADAPYTESLFTFSRNALIGNAMDTGGGEDWTYNKQFYDGYTAGSVVDYQKNYWPNNLSGVGFAGLSRVTGATNASPIVLTVAPMACVPNPGDRYMVSGVRGNLGANGSWVIKAATSTSLTLVGAIGTGAYTAGTGTVIPVSGKCNNVTNWALGSASAYKAGKSYVAPASDLTTAGQGPAKDASEDPKDVGADIDALSAAIGSGAVARCSVSLGTDSVNYPGEGGAQIVALSASGPDCPWTIVNAPSWMIFIPIEGTGSGEIVAAALPNPGVARRASVAIGDQIFSVSQDGMPVGFGGGSTGFGSSVGLSSAVSLE